jgi:trimethylamine--corrinoid protein Co-methyltransferase
MVTENLSAIIFILLILFILLVQTRRKTMTSPNLARPKLALLDQEQIERIHSKALKILGDTGVRVDLPATRQVLAGKGAQVDGEIVKIPAELVASALQSAPNVIDVYNRRGEPAFHLGNDRMRFGIGVTSLFYQDPLSDNLVPFGRRHMRELVRLGDSLPHFDEISTVGVLQDVPARVSDLYATLDMVCNTTKPLVILISDENVFPAVLDLLEDLHGDLQEKPFVIPYFNPVTPLVMNQGTLEKMESAIGRGLPFIFSNYSMAGLSTPITPAGTLALLLAELLAGLTISQVYKEGTPIILSMLPAWFDMKTMVNFYEPQSLLINLACAEIMAHYGLPHAGTSGSGTGWGPDLLASETYWINHLTFCLTNGGLAPFVGDTLTSKAFSAPNVVYVHEVIAQSLLYAQGLRLDEAAFVLDEIQQEGPGGNFLTTETTLATYKKAYYTSPIFARWSLETWMDKGRPQAIDILRQYTMQLLSNLKAPADHDELLGKGEAFIERWAKK